MSEECIRVVIADDREALLARYKRYLQRDDGIHVVACATSGYEAVGQAIHLKPDVVLMDIEMESRDAGILASRQIIKSLPQTRVIMLTVHSSDEMIFAAYQMGACDYLLKDASAQALITSVRNAYHHCSPIRTEIAGRIRREFRRLKDCESNFIQALKLVYMLTPSEINILYLFSQKKTYEDICRLRFVEMSTLKTQIHSILKKLSVRSMAEALSVIEKTNLLSVVMRDMDEGGLS